MVALTSNTEAGKGAFYESQPGTSVIEGSEHEVGVCTYYLVFELDCPKG